MIAHRSDRRLVTYRRSAPEPPQGPERPILRSSHPVRTALASRQPTSRRAAWVGRPIPAASGGSPCQLRWWRPRPGRTWYRPGSIQDRLARVLVTVGTRLHGEGGTRPDDGRSLAWMSPVSRRPCLHPDARRGDIAAILTTSCGAGTSGATPARTVRERWRPAAAAGDRGPTLERLHDEPVSPRALGLRPKAAANGTIGSGSGATRVENRRCGGHRPHRGHDWHCYPSRWPRAARARRRRC
jgi:hypothetical protein